jgi:hypothetical protein
VPLPELQATEIYMECHLMALPIHIPPMEMVFLKTFNKNNTATPNGQWMTFATTMPRSGCGLTSK